MASNFWTENQPDGRMERFRRICEMAARIFAAQGGAQSPAMCFSLARRFVDQVELERKQVFGEEGSPDGA